MSADNECLWVVERVYAKGESPNYRWIFRTRAAAQAFARGRRAVGRGRFRYRTVKAHWGPEQ